MEKNDFPAKLILSAIREDEFTGHRIVCFADEMVLESEDDLNRRHGFCQALEVQGGLPYDYTVVHIDELDEAIADIKATLEAQVHSEAGDADTPPAPESPPAKEEPASDDTTNAAGGQIQPGNGHDIEAAEPQRPPVIAMVVRYQGTGAMVIPTGPYDGATDELVQWHDGRSDRPPDKNVARLRNWLRERGYRESWPEWEWLDRGHGPRRRREIYRLNGHTGVMAPDSDRYPLAPVNWDFLRQFAKEHARPELPEADRRALYKAKALAGEPHFEACPDCPHVQNCPYGWAACDRKAEFARERREQDLRPEHKLFVPCPSYGIQLPG